MHVLFYYKFVTFNFVEVVHVRNSQASLTLLSLNRNFLTILDIDAACGMSYLADIADAPRLLLFVPLTHLIIRRPHLHVAHSFGGWEGYVKLKLVIVICN